MFTLTTHDPHIIATPNIIPHYCIMLYIQPLKYMYVLTNEGY